MELTIKATSIKDERAAPLLRALSRVLGSITGSTGESSFATADLDDARSIFLLVEVDGVPKACGALRKVDEETCEIKRMYASEGRAGTGSQLLAELERRAFGFGYKRVILETRSVNIAAVSFYRKNGYVVIPNYGKYLGNTHAVCFAKDLEPNQSKDWLAQCRLRSPK